RCPDPLPPTLDRPVRPARSRRRSVLPRLRGSTRRAAAACGSGGMTAFSRIAVLGGGAWGTALALAAARAGREVTLWGRDAATLRAVNDEHHNPAYLPGIRFDVPL